MRTEIQINNKKFNKKVARQLNTFLLGINSGLEKEAVRTFDTIGILVSGEAKELINKKSPSVGRRLRYSGTGRARVVYPAKEGFPPNTDTGTLINSISWGRRGMEVYIGSTVKYSQYLEDTGSKNRPFLVPALEQQRKKVDTLLQQFLNRAVTQASRKSPFKKKGKKR